MLATIINFSTNEAPFLRQCLEEALVFSDQVIVPVCDHFFDGSPEDLTLLQSIYPAHPDVQFVQFPYTKENFYGWHSAHYWHNLSRLAGLSRMKESITHILFLDADEIVEGIRFKKWLTTFPLQDYRALTLACHWYFREPSYRATQVEDTPLLTCKSALHYDALMNEHERAGTFAKIEGHKARFISEGTPLIHHYSWVRSKEGLLKKVRTWGHRTERNWEALIEEEFSRPFSGTDFVHGYTFEKVEPFLKTHSYEMVTTSPKNVTYLSTRDIHKIDLELKFLND